MNKNQAYYTLMKKEKVMRYKGVNLHRETYADGGTVLVSDMGTHFSIDGFKESIDQFKNGIETLLLDQ